MTGESKSRLKFSIELIIKISDFIYEYNYHYITFQVKHQIDRIGDEFWNDSMNSIGISNTRRN